MGKVKQIIFTAFLLTLTFATKCQDWYKVRSLVSSSNFPGNFDRLINLDNGEFLMWSTIDDTLHFDNHLYHPSDKFYSYFLFLDSETGNVKEAIIDTNDVQVELVIPINDSTYYAVKYAKEGEVVSLFNHDYTVPFFEGNTSPATVIFKTNLKGEATFYKSVRGFLRYSHLQQLNFEGALYSIQRSINDTIETTLFRTNRHFEDSIRLDIQSKDLNNQVWIKDYTSAPNGDLFVLLHTEDNMVVVNGDTVFNESSFNETYIALKYAASGQLLWKQQWRAFEGSEFGFRYNTQDEKLYLIARSGSLLHSDSTYFKITTHPNFPEMVTSWQNYMLSISGATGEILTFQNIYGIPLAGYIGALVGFSSQGEFITKIPIGLRNEHEDSTYVHFFNAEGVDIKSPGEGVAIVFYDDMGKITRYKPIMREVEIKFSYINVLDNGDIYGLINTSSTRKLYFNNQEITSHPFKEALIAYRMQCDQAVGIQEPPISSAALVPYPNPTPNELRLEGGNSSFQYHLYTLQGQLVEKGYLSNQGTVSLNHVPSQMYLLQLTSPQGAVAQYKIVKE